MACTMNRAEEQPIFYTEAPSRKSSSMSASCEGGARSMVVPSKLFIGGLTRHTTTKQLRDHFCSYGRVLDCVAMRQPDGRPRGFGYVTLDSPVAAEACLQVPQVIDGRVVDVKRAVPGFAMDSPCNAGMSPAAAGGRSRKGSAPMLPPGQWETLGPYLSSGFAASDHSPAAAAAAAAAWWAGAGPAAGTDMHDYLELMRVGAVPPSPASMLGAYAEPPTGRFCMGSGGAVCESLGLLTAGSGAGLTSAGSFGRSGLGMGRRASEDAASPSITTPAKGAGNGGLSANAAEFVPRGVTPQGQQVVDDDTPQKVESSFNKTSRNGRAVLGEITNILGGSAAGKISDGKLGGSPVKAPLPSAAGRNGLGLLQVFDDKASPDAKPVPLKPGLVQNKENRPPALFIYEDADDEGNSYKTPCKPDVAEDSDTSDAQSTDGMPSAGSTEPASLSSCGLPPGLSPPQRRPSQATPSAAGILSTVPTPSAASAGLAAVAAARTWTPQGSASLGPALLSTTPKASNANPTLAAAMKEATPESASDDGLAALTGFVWTREELLSHRIFVPKESK